MLRREHSWHGANFADSGDVSDVANTCSNRGRSSCAGRCNSKDEDALDQEALEVERIRVMAREACMAKVERHLASFLIRRPYASFEEWIQELHPENLHTDPRTGEVKLDHRLYGKDGQHRRLWNLRVDASRQVFASRPSSVVVTRSTPTTPRLSTTPRLFSPPPQLGSAASTPAFPTGHVSHVSSELPLLASAHGPPSARGVRCVSTPRCAALSAEPLRPQLTRVDGMTWLGTRTETQPEPRLQRRSIPPPAPLRVQLAPLPVLRSNTPLLQRTRQQPLGWSVRQFSPQRPPPPRVAVVSHKQQVPFWPQAGVGVAAIWPQTAVCAVPACPLQPFWPSTGVSQTALQTTRAEVRAAFLGGA